MNNLFGWINFGKNWIECWIEWFFSIIQRPIEFSISIAQGYLVFDKKYPVPNPTQTEISFHYPKLNPTRSWKTRLTLNLFDQNNTEVGVVIWKPSFLTNLEFEERLIHCYFQEQAAVDYPLVTCQTPSIWQPREREGTRQGPGWRKRWQAESRGRWRGWCLPRRWWRMGS